MLIVVQLLCILVYTYEIKPLGLAKPNHNRRTEFCAAIAEAWTLNLQALLVHDSLIQQPLGVAKPNPN